MKFMLKGHSMAAILFVKAKSSLDIEQLDEKLLERTPQFKNVPGLIQK